MIHIPLWAIIAGGRLLQAYVKNRPAAAAPPPEPSGFTYTLFAVRPAILDAWCEQNPDGGLVSRFADEIGANPKWAAAARELRQEARALAAKHPGCVIVIGNVKTY